MTNDFDALELEVLENREARVAFTQHRVCRQVAMAIDTARKEQQLSLRALAVRVGIPFSQVKKLLRHEYDASLTLHAICKIADTLGLHVVVQVTPGSDKHNPFVKAD